ncbi:MAG TPA: transketolase [Chthonomonadaceae bacterium]|nr:transketolase [Chthonomonadaceae bacterium]
MVEERLDVMPVAALKARAKNLRRHVLRMAEVAGQGYVGQGLDIADLLAVLYFHEMRYDPNRLDWPDRDRFVLSIGHYSIGLYAALAEAGVFPLDELDTYGKDGSRLEMSGSEATPGFEITGGSLGHGLSQAVGMALGLRLDGRQARIFNLLSDGELQEGATWEAAMAGAHYRLDNLFCFIDCNSQQADGPPQQIMGIEPVQAKWKAFGWQAQRINGNDITAILAAIDTAKAAKGRPHAIVLDTVMGKGVPLFEQREKNHFIRVDAGEWAIARAQLEAGE